MNNLIINSAIKENHFKEKKENTEVWMNIFFYSLFVQNCNSPV